MAKTPTLKFLFAHPAHFLACGCGSGLSQWAPGTVGTLFAWMSYILIKPYFTDLEFGMLVLIGYVAGFRIIQIAGRALGEPDHRSIVWDEIIPFWGVLLLTPPQFMWQLTAFCLFRFFDIAKPQPARWFDDQDTGFGVMTDDVVAGFYTLLVIAVLKWILG